MHRPSSAPAAFSAAAVSAAAVSATAFSATKVSAIAGSAAAVAQPAAAVIPVVTIAPAASGGARMLVPQCCRRLPCRPTRR